MNTSQLPDVQAGRPEVEVGLERVGVTGVQKLVEVGREDDRPLVFMAEFDVYVDLPAERKGIDMSRNMEVTNEVVDDLTREPVYRVEDLCAEIAERLLGRHDYTTRTEVEMEADYMYRERTPASDLDTQGFAVVHASAVATDEGVRRSIGVEVTGTTACPCAQGMMEGEAAEKLDELGLSDSEVDDFLSDVPQAAHNQRSRSYLSVEGEDVEVDVDDLLEIARDSMSSRIYNLAKRPDEHHMVQEMHRNSKFVEDVVREMAREVVASLDLSDDAVVSMKQVNEESIHQHDAYSERVARYGDLRDQIRR
ncbi:MAG: GTP cyclohydrolase MptA [Halobacteriales archaeon]